MRTRVKKVLGYLVAIIGLISSIIGIWVFFYKPIPDSEINLVPTSANNITIKKQQDIDGLHNPIRASVITIDGVKIELPTETVILANQINLINGAEVIGDSIAIAATEINGGRVTSNLVRDQLHGGDLFLAVAVLNGTAIEANGSNGRDGIDGDDGKNGGPGRNGGDGNCDGFGRWRASQAGLSGGNGGDGKNGEDGERGGDAGNILLLTSYEPTVQPIAKAGVGGNGGRGGVAGRGGVGGRGGSGCSGLGGSQDGKSNGADGIDGKPGKDGRKGVSGISKEPVVKFIEFSHVKDAVSNENATHSEILNSLRKIRPRN